MNWGKGITIAIILFMCFIGSMVYVAFTKNADLIDDDYYENELLFDQTKAEKFNYKKLGAVITVKHQEAGVTFNFPNLIEKNVEGTIIFYRPDQKKYDRNFDLKISDNHTQTIAYNNFVDGYYTISVKWKDSTDKGYIFESNISF